MESEKQTKSFIYKQIVVDITAMRCYFISVNFKFTTKNSFAAQLVGEDSRVRVPGEALPVAHVAKSKPAREREMQQPGRAAGPPWHLTRKEKYG